MGVQVGGGHAVPLIAHVGDDAEVAEIAAEAAIREAPRILY